MGIRTGHCKSLVHQNLCQTAHADATNPYKMHMLWFVKIYLIHTVIHPFIFSCRQCSTARLLILLLRWSSSIHLLVLLFQ